jgi:hypothetical protein
MNSNNGKNAATDSSLKIDRECSVPELRAMAEEIAISIVQRIFEVFNWSAWTLEIGPRRDSSVDVSAAPVVRWCGISFGRFADEVTLRSHACEREKW